jgi:prepilin-type N-terminal cleavage/methylation domain-containing protein
MKVSRGLVGNVIVEKNRRRACGFTVIELLAVIAIIGILLAILIPSVASARTTANKARTRAQFNQWAAAIELFRSEYGYYPAFDSTFKVNGGATATGHLFHDLLAARKRDGSALAVDEAAALQNKKLIRFHVFAETDFADAGSADAGLLCDAFGTTDIAVLIDRNLDGVINTDDYGSDLPAVNGSRPTANDFPTAGLRAGVVFYDALPGSSDENPAFIFSWK